MNERDNLAGDRAPTRRELDQLLAGWVNRRDRRYLYQVLDEVGLRLVRG